MTEKMYTLKDHGVPCSDDLASAAPDPERLARGPVAIIECFQRIPCDPCAVACPRGAIEPFSDICDLPALDQAKCNGCALCVAKCPGLAVFILDVSRPGPAGLVTLPYEYLPLPSPGDEVTGLDRAGDPVGAAKIVKVRRPAAFDRTALVTIEVPKEQAMRVRGIRLERPPAPGEGRGEA